MIECAAGFAIRALFRLDPVASPFAEAALPTADAQQTACIRLLLRDWVDPPKNRFEAARRDRLPLSPLFHDPAWEPLQQQPLRLPEQFPEGLR